MAGQEEAGATDKSPTDDVRWCHRSRFGETSVDDVGVWNLAPFHGAFQVCCGRYFYKT